MKFLLVLVSYIALTSALKLEQPKEERTFQDFIQTTDGYLYLSLNNTLLQFATVGLVLLVIGGLVISSVDLPLAAQNIHRKTQEFSEELFVDTEGADQQTRSKRFAHNGKKISNMNTIPYSTFKEV